MRTIIELPEEQLAGLDGWCRREGISRAEAIRRAIAAMLAERAKGAAAGAFGIWRDRATEALAEQEKIRNEWREP